jgi:hypothetical protein
MQCKLASEGEIFGLFTYDKVKFQQAKNGDQDLNSLELHSNFQLQRV